MPLHLREHASIVWDSAITNMCPSSYMLNKLDLRVSILWDGLHKVWRCMWAACTEAGLMGAVHLSSCIATMERGPWDGEATWQKELGATQELRILAPRISEVLFLYNIVPGVLRDRGEDPLDLSPEKATEIAVEIVDEAWLQEKPRRVATTRWSSWHDQMDDTFEPFWHSETMVVATHGLLEGWLPAANRSLAALITPKMKVLRNS